jgi:hypothetical protein
MVRATEKLPKAHPVVVGVADHNGWAILVSAAKVNGEPTVIDRRRVELIQHGLPSQPYHHETLVLPDDKSELLLRKVQRSIDGCTASAFDRLTADLLPLYRVSAIAIRQPPLTEWPATVAEIHNSYYVTCRADGMLYHSAICAAARQRDWKVALHRRGEEVALAAAALQMSTHDVEQFLDDLRATLGPPWTAEYRRAFAAAIGRLSKLRALRSELNATTR